MNFFSPREETDQLWSDFIIKLLQHKLLLWIHMLGSVSHGNGVEFSCPFWLVKLQLKMSMSMIRKVWGVLIYAAQQCKICVES